MSNVIQWILPLLLLILFVVAHIIYIYSFCLATVTNLYHRIAFLITINCVGGMFLWSISATICSSVGDVPDEYKFKQSEHNKLVRATTEDERDAILEKFCDRNNLLLRNCTPTGSIRYCVSCMHIKPDRAHHCSTCKSCYLKMDHHCPWVNNCVGFRNYKSFLLSLFYGFLYCLFYTLSTSHYVVFYANYYIADLALPIGFGLALIMAITTMGFLAYHIYLLLRNETTLENTHPPTFVEDDMTFDLGAAQNFLAVFGKPCCFWLLPIFTSLESGDIFMVERIERS